MSLIVLLDSGPLGMVTNPRASFANAKCNQWLEGLLIKGIQVAVPEIADYEVRRELLRANKILGLTRLNAVKAQLDYLPLTTDIMLQAAQFWAQARQMGKPTANDAALDGDVILAAQSYSLSILGYNAVIATTNVRHLSLFVKAEQWDAIN
jgi:predicted nucleic acid-binding protein